jgi:hypothetical protein
LQITNDEGRRIELKTALHVPSFTSNLIFVSKADSAGGLFSGGKGKMQVTDALGNILVKGAFRKGLYHANCTMQPVSKACATAAKATDAVIFHRRL